jgi:X-Pro dipeptidyl-peptidase
VQHKVRRLVVVMAAATASLVAMVAPSAAGAAPSAGGAESKPAYRLGSDGTTAPIYSYTKAIRETVWVDIGLDQDGDGIGDRVAVDIIRPSEPAARREKIPAIMDTSGYYQSLGRGNENQIKTYDKRGRPVQFPLFLDNFFVPRGYAVVLPDLAGTNRSTGCTDFGGPSELASSTRAIDWLNGRAPGYSSPLGSKLVSATWASGSVGMIGKSWDGQNVFETAVTGIEGLDAIVPEAGVSSDWTDFYLRTGTNDYLPTTADYTRYFTGLQNSRAEHNKNCQKLLDQVAAGEPTNGDYTEQWAYRDWSNRAGNIKAATLMVQGQNDYTVIPANVGPLWDKLSANLPKKLWLSETGHVDPFDFRRAEWVDVLHHWFDRYLYKIHNGVEKTPQLSVERSPSQWRTYDSFPAAGTSTRQLYAGGTTDAADLGTLSQHKATKANWVKLTSKVNNVGFVTAPLSAPVRLSGTVNVVANVASSVTTNATVEGAIVDLGPTTTRGDSGRPDSNSVDTGILEPNTTKTCWGESRPGDSACFFVTPPDVITVPALTLGFGARDLRHHSSVRTVQHIVAGKGYALAIPTWTMDRIVPAGHRLGIEIDVFGTSAATFQVNTSLTRVALPVVGGAFHFGRGSAGTPAAVPGSFARKATPALPMRLVPIGQSR